MPIVMSRFFNIYGPRQGLDQVIPKFILQILNNKNMTIYGDGTQTRDYTYVDDAVNAYALLGLTKNIEGKVINFGSGKEIQIKNLAKLIIKLCNTDGKLTFSKKLRTGETPRLLCKPLLAKKILNWSTKTDIESGLSKTIEYYKKRKHLVENLPFML